MKRVEASPDVVEKIQTFQRMPFNQFKELVKSGQITSMIKLKKPRTIFYDEKTCNFLYLNPYHGNFNKCGEWTELNEE